MRKVIVILLVLCLHSAQSMVFTGSLTTTTSPTFEYITKFAFDPACKNTATCTLTITWVALDNSSGVFAVYDDTNWENATKATTCYDQVAAIAPGGVLLTFDGTNNITVDVHENYQHWWYIAVANCEQTVNVDFTMTFLNQGSQFGYNEMGMLPLYVFFLVLQSCMLVFLALYKRFSFLSYRVSAFVAVSMLIEAAGMLLSVLHWATYASTGQGVVESGNWLEELATCVLVAGILHGAAGWNANQIHSYGIYSNRIFIGIIATVSILYIILLIWAIVMRNQWWFQDYIYESAPGAIVMAFRMLIGIWFAAQLRDTMRREQNPDKKNVYLQFGVISFLWLWAVPIAAFIGFAVESFYQLKVVSSLFLTFDTLAFFGLLYVLRPSVVEAHFTTLGLMASSLAVPAQPPPQLAEEFLSTGDRDEDQRL